MPFKNAAWYQAIGRKQCGCWMA